jgi:hypothetical protein
VSATGACFGLAVGALLRRRSVHGAGWHDPLARLAGHAGDAVEVGVVVKDREVSHFGCGRDEQVGHVASALVFGKEQPLNVSRPSQVIGGRLDQL